MVIASAWLVSDHVIVDLFRRFTDYFPVVVGVDTLHLFQETHDVCARQRARMPESPVNCMNQKVRPYRLPCPSPDLAPAMRTFGPGQQLSRRPSLYCLLEESHFALVCPWVTAHVALVGSANVA